MLLQEATKAAGTYTDLQAKLADEEVWKPLRHGHLLSSKGEGLEELHFEVRGGHRGKIERPQTRFCVFYKTTKRG